MKMVGNFENFNVFRIFNGTNESVFARHFFRFRVFIIQGTGITVGNRKYKARTNVFYVFSSIVQKAMIMTKSRDFHIAVFCNLQ